MQANRKYPCLFLHLLCREDTFAGFLKKKAMRKMLQLPDLYRAVVSAISYRKTKTDGCLLSPEESEDLSEKTN